MIRFTVPGIAQPKGSNRIRGGVITADNRNTKPWQRSIGWVALGAMRARPLYLGPISISIWFYFERPPTQRPPRARPDVKPDIDKLTRCACDALTGVVYRDDCQVVHLNAWKYYGTPARAEFVIREVSNGENADLRETVP